MQNQMDQRRVIIVDDNILVAILLSKKCKVIEVFQSPPEYKTKFLFLDGIKARRIIRTYLARPLEFSYLDYGEKLDDILYEESDRKQYIKHTAANLL